MHRRENGLHLSYCNRERPPHKREKKGPFQPPTAMTIPFPSCERACKETLPGSSCIQVPHVDFHGDSATCNRGFQGNCRHLLLHTTSSARANHHPRDETTEPKNANAETGQHLFFFPCSDTTAALHFFLSKGELLRFSNARYARCLANICLARLSHACKKH